MTISEKLSETIAQKERIASEVVLQSDKITEINSGIYDILESDEIPENKNKLTSLIDRSITTVTEEDFGNATVIERYQFYGCYNLNSVVLPNSVVIIRDNAFAYCEHLMNIVIPNSVTNIGDNALKIGSSSDKATITFLSTTPPTILSNTFNENYLQNIIVPKGCGETYKSATSWSNFDVYIVEASE